ncbi:hypothetical protein GOAMI_14_00310 [Gordonia amicalis NBRC 100051 = JCM 11271]|nr:hypothetical protein GOAMI_14_00310 [Gordonia amicalis NBRC 100051 = JCM 11271]
MNRFQCRLLRGGKGCRSSVLGITQHLARGSRPDPFADPVDTPVRTRIGHPGGLFRTAPTTLRSAGFRALQFDFV